MSWTKLGAHTWLRRPFHVNFPVYDDNGDDGDDNGDVDVDDATLYQLVLLTSISHAEESYSDTEGGALGRGTECEFVAMRDLLEADSIMAEL